MKYSIRFFLKNRVINISFAIALIILTGMGWLTYRYMDLMQESGKWEMHTYIVIQELDKMFSELKDIETGERGYVITNDSTYLEPYTIAISQLDGRMAKLISLTSDNIDQKERLKQLDTLIKNKERVINQIIEIQKHKGFTKSSLIIKTKRGKKIMDEIRAQVKECQNQEELLLQIRHEQKIRDDSRFINALITGTIISLIILLLVFYLLMHDNNLRKKSENELKLRTEELDKFFEVTPNLLCISHFNGYFVKLNRHWEDIFGYTMKELTTKSYLEFIHPDDIKPTKVAVEEQLGHKDVLNFVNRYRTKSGDYRWLEWNSTPRGDFMYAAARDITENRLQEQRLKRLNRTYAMLSHVNEMMVRAGDKKNIYNEICRIAIEDGKFLLSWIGEVDEKNKRVMPIAFSGSKIEYLDDLIITIDDNPTSKGPTGRSIKEARTVFCNDIEKADTMLPWREKALKMGFRSSASFPIIIDNKVISCFTLYSEEPYFFDHDELRLYKDLCADIAFSITYINKEKERKEASVYARRLIEASIDPLVTINREGKITDVNEATVNITGVQRKELIGTEFSGYFTKPDKAREGYMKVFEHGIVKDYPLTVKSKTGKNVEVLYNAIVYKDDEGNVSGVFAAARDITEIKRQEENFKGLFDAAPDGMVIVDREGNILNVNNQVEKLFSYKSSELIGKKVELLVPQRYHGIHSQHRDDYNKNPRVRPMGIGLDLFATRKDGSEFPVEISLAPVVIQGGCNVLASIRDITDRKKLEEEIHESRERLDLALEAGQTGAWELDLEKDTTIRNLRHDQIFGYNTPLKEWGVKIFLEHIVYDDREHVEQDFKQALETGVFKTECRIIWPDKSIHWIYSSGKLVVNKNTKSDQLIGTIIDITERKELEDKLNRYVEEIKRSNKELEQFAYVASHDLKEPLRMVSSYTQLLAERYRDKLDKDANEFIGFAVDGAMRMQMLINDLLAYSRINTQGQEFREVDMQAKLGEVLSILSQSIMEKGALVTNDNLPLVFADSSQMYQLLQNLISNALKFCEKDPRIFIGLKENKNEWIFFIKDNGIGIESKYKDKIFLIFQRLHTRTEYPGTGIGLAVCKRIVERHYGKIWFESEQGKGTTFFFTLPKKI